MKDGETSPGSDYVGYDATARGLQLEIVRLWG